MRVIPQRELRNNIARVLREVEGGERLRVTIDGRPVADLVPVEASRRTYVPREEIVWLLEQAPMDSAVSTDIAETLGATVDEL